MQDERVQLMIPRWRNGLRRPVKRQAGIALIVVTVTTAVLGAVVGDFAYNARVDLEAAANGRDELRAEYLARSGIHLARLLMKVQQSVLDKNAAVIGDIQIADFAPYLVKVFGGERDEQAGLGALIGVDFGRMKGLGVGKSASFDMNMEAEDGRLNLNCGGGLSDLNKQGQLYAVLSALLWPPRYNRMFETADADGQYYTRDDIARAILDWADTDEQKYAPPGSSSGAEDYRYDGQRDPYRAHNHLYDTLEEVNLVRGVGDSFWGSFGEMLTVYGGCRINVSAIKPEHWPLMAAIIRATVKDDRRNDQMVVDDVQLAQAAQMVIGLSKMMGGFRSTKDFIDLLTNPSSLAGASGGPKIPGLPVDSNKLSNVITVGPRRFYRIDATGTIQRTREKKIQSHIRAIWSMDHVNQQPKGNDPDDLRGTWVYWRED